MDIHTKFQKNLKKNRPVIKFFIFLAGSFVGQVGLDGLLRDFVLRSPRSKYILMQKIKSIGQSITEIWIFSYHIKNVSKNSYSPASRAWKSALSLNSKLDHPRKSQITQNFGRRLLNVWENIPFISLYSPAASPKVSRSFGWSYKEIKGGLPHRPDLPKNDRSYAVRYSLRSTDMP